MKKFSQIKREIYKMKWKKTENLIICQKIVGNNERVKLKDTIA